MSEDYPITTSGILIYRLVSKEKKLTFHSEKSAELYKNVLKKKGIDSKIIKELI